MKTKFSDLLTYIRQRGISPRNVLLWLLAAAAVTAAAFFCGGISSAQAQIFPVYITEVMASNTGYPNSDGLCCDYIEIHNSADYSVELTGFQLGDVAGKSRYAFPAGTVLQSGEYLTVSCDKTMEADTYAPFEINRAGGETFYLIARNGAIVDSVTTLPMDIDQVMLLGSDGTWLVCGDASPGGSTDAGSSYGDIYNENLSQVRFTEFSAAETGYLPELGIFCDWVELHNAGDTAADISGFILSDNPGNDKYTFPQGTLIAPGSYLVVSCAEGVSDPGVAPFGLSRQHTETLVLKNAQGRIVEILHTAPTGEPAQALTDQGQWAACDTPSPGYENTPQGREQFLSRQGIVPGSIRISEVMAAGQLVISDGFGEFSDWVELHNTTEQAVDLSGWCLSDDPAQPRKWVIPHLVLPAGARAVIFCSGRDTEISGLLHAGFALSSGGETLTLSAWTGETVDQVTFPESQAHSAFVFDGEKPALTALPTPGYPNDEAGYTAFQASMVPAGDLAIWEVMTSNDRYLPQNLGQCYDWVELHNVSGSTLDLTGWSLSDDLGDPSRFTLEGISLKPDQSLVVILTDEPNAVKKGFLQANFRLDVREDQLFLFDPEGMLKDFVLLKDIPLGFSYGRSPDSGGFFHMEPSPQNPNHAGYRLISGAIASSCVPGVYSLEDGISLTLEARGTIHYTTDGSVPDASSPRYDAPLQIGKTTVIRAVSIEEGKLPGEVYTATFIIGDKHQLPVVSLVTAPGNLWGRNGIYKSGRMSVKEIQVPAHVSYSGSDGSFAINCALNLHGATTVVAFDKKSFAVRFQDRFDGALHYDVFEDGVVTDFSSLIIRTSHESTYSSQMHDAFISHIATQASDLVLTQKYKYVALYLNGEYWGLYALRERHSPEHFANYMDTPAENVQTVRYMIDEKNELWNLFYFCKRNNLRSEKNYAYVKSVINVESFADWLIYEAYMANVDVNENIRYYRNPVDGLWYMGLADLDLGMMGAKGSFSLMAESFHHGTLVSALITNEEFQHLLATRLAQLLEGPLSDENTAAVINQIADTIRPETAWEAKRWGTPVSAWETTVSEMLRFCDGRAQELIDNLCQTLRFSAQERETYFGHLE